VSSAEIIAALGALESGFVAEVASAASEEDIRLAQAR
jgi:hypothetical protein